MYEVTQVDRECAARIRELFGTPAEADYTQGVMAVILDGRGDGFSLVQEVARHRIRNSVSDK